MDVINQQQLKESLSYCKDTGVFTWNRNGGGRVKSGDVAGTYDKGYRYIKIAGKKRAAHRLAWLYVYGTFPDGEIDHINHVKDDNRISNLRDVTTKGNALNRKIFSTNTSGFTGVVWDKSRELWTASIMVNYKRKTLGRFQDKSEAVKCRLEAEVKYGFHKNHGQL